MSAGWGIYLSGGVRHVAPINDERTHVLATNCACRPKVIQDERGDIISHLAWDCRELIEEAEAIKEAA